MSARGDLIFRAATGREPDDVSDDIVVGAMWLRMLCEELAAAKAEADACRAELYATRDALRRERKALKRERRLMRPPNYVPQEWTP